MTFSSFLSMLSCPLLSLAQSRLKSMNFLEQLYEWDCWQKSRRHDVFAWFKTSLLQPGCSFMMSLPKQWWCMRQRRHVKASWMLFWGQSKGWIASKLICFSLFALHHSFFVLACSCVAHTLLAVTWHQPWQLVTLCSQEKSPADPGPLVLIQWNSVILHLVWRKTCSCQPLLVSPPLLSSSNNLPWTAKQSTLGFLAGKFDMGALSGDDDSTSDLIIH